MRSSIGNWMAVLGLLAAAVPPAHAQASEEPWQYGATLYLWLPGISGRTQFPGNTFKPSEALQTLTFNGLALGVTVRC